MSIRKNESKLRLSEVKKVFHKWLYLEHDEMLDVMFAVHIANCFDADPLWMIFIGPPSSTKTEILRSFDGYPDAYFLSNLTPNTLVSGMMARKGQDEPSLLPRLTDKTLILKDFTSILSMRSEDQKEILGQLREAADGRYDKTFGNGKQVSWEGKFGLMAACTPIYDQHYGVIGTLGDRFLLYRIPAVDSEKMGLQAMRIVGEEGVMRGEIREVCHRFLDQQNGLANIRFEHDNNVNSLIVGLACLCAYARCPVERNYRDRTIDYTPQPEGAARLTKQFKQLGMGIALVHDKNKIDDHVYRIVKKVGRDLIPAVRLDILRFLWQEEAFEHTFNWLKTKSIASGVRMPTGTVKLKLEDLMIVGLLNRQTVGESDTAAYQWQLTTAACEMITKCHFFTN